MNEKKYTFLTTTINLPIALNAYGADAEKYGNNVDFLIVGDYKTPKDLPKFCQEFEQKYSFKCEYMSVEDQIDYLKQWPEFRDFLPWNTPQRRDVGLIKAYEGDSDIVVVWDDDNFLLHDNYLGLHSHVGDIIDVNAINSASGWWNVCDMLNEAKGYRFYHRGYPLSERHNQESEYFVHQRTTGRVVVNAGLWLDDPDIDALSRLFVPIQVDGVSELYEDRLALNVGTLSPFNSQNTALLREIIPAYLQFPHVGRYDDIWGSYVLRRISDHFGDLVTYGAPLVRQKRNPHDYLVDLENEQLGMRYTEAVIEALYSCEISSDTYAGAFSDIAESFALHVEKSCTERGYSSEPLEGFCNGMKIWRDVFVAIG